MAVFLLPRQGIFTRVEYLPYSLSTGVDYPPQALATPVGSKVKMTTMDTDDLSTEAYQGIIIEAEKFNHNLTLQFGVLASHCKDEEEYLDKASDLISEFKSMAEEELIDVFFGTLPDIKSLNITLDRIIANIDKVRKNTKDQRHYEF